MKNAKYVGYRDYRTLLEILTRLVQKELKGCLVSIVLYGSVARGKAKLESDVDILIIQSQAPDDYYKRLEPIISVDKKLKDTKAYREFESKSWFPYLSYIIFSEEEAKENRYLFLGMVSDSIILFDTNSFFKKRLEDVRKRLKVLGSKKVYMDDGTWYWDLKPDLVAGEVFEL